VEEDEITLANKDFAILNKFDFDVEPVGVKLLAKRPDMGEKLTENMALCEMLKRAQDANAYYADKENHTCNAPSFLLGLEQDVAETLGSGEFGAGLRTCEEPRSAAILMSIYRR